VQEGQHECDRASCHVLAVRPLNKARRVPGQLVPKLLPLGGRVPTESDESIQPHPCATKAPVINPMVNSPQHAMIKVRASDQQLERNGAQA
jgi:hypothetical protein